MSKLNILHRNSQAKYKPRRRKRQLGVLQTGPIGAGPLQLPQLLMQKKAKMKRRNSNLRIYLISVCNKYNVNFNILFKYVSKILMVCLLLAHQHIPYNEFNFFNTSNISKINLTYPHIQQCIILGTLKEMEQASM